MAGLWLALTADKGQLAISDYRVWSDRLSPHRPLIRRIIQIYRLRGVTNPDELSFRGDVHVTPRGRSSCENQCCVTSKLYQRHQIRSVSMETQGVVVTLFQFIVPLHGRWLKLQQRCSYKFTNVVRPSLEIWPFYWGPTYFQYESRITRETRFSKQNYRPSNS